MTNPEVRIMFSDLLYYSESQNLAKSYNRKIEISEEECYRQTHAYKKAWAKKEDAIVTGMQKIFGLTFYKPVIDVTLAPAFGPKSLPLIINFQYKSDMFIDILTHELFHNLFTDNQYVQHGKRDNLIEVWRELFPEDLTPTTRVHIPVHAGLKAIYLDVLDEPKRLARDIEECQQWPDYKAAWEYVEQHDYKKIIKKFKDSYKNGKYTTYS